MADGRFDLTLLRPFPIARVAGMLPRVYNGTLGQAEGAIRRKIWRLEALTPISLELDGEPQGEEPVSISVLPRILQVRGGWLRPPQAE